MAFSHDVKDELARQESRKACCSESEPLAALVLTGRIAADGVSMTTTHAAYADRLDRQLKTLSGAPVAIRRESGHLRISVESPEGCLRLMDALDRAGFDPVSRQVSPAAFSSVCCRRAALRGLFLAGGSVGDSARGYHLEIVSRHEAAVRMAVRLMRAEGMRPRVLLRKPLFVAYLKDGGQVADFLLVTGAHGALLSFESLRVEKDMRNAVNRMVNCDTANSTRVANAAARQLELLHVLERGPGLGTLPDDLHETAKARLESGMNHRLRRLERIAEEYIASVGKTN
jgi:DNA-binding protein WhiA